MNQSTNPLMIFILEDGISYIFYFLFFLALYRLLVAINEKEIKGRKVRKKVKRRLKKQVIEAPSEGFNDQSRTLSNLELLLRATSKDQTKLPSVFAFLLLCVSLGGATFLLLLSRLGDLYIATGIGLFVTCLPYFRLKVKLRKLKSTVGNKITRIIEELLHFYSASGQDMYQAVKGVATNTQDPHFRKFFIQIASAMHLRQEQAIDEAIEVMTFSISGTWAKQLGNIIKTGYINSTNVMPAMVQLSNNAQHTEGMLKEEKSAAFGVVIAAYSTVPFLIGALVINYWVTKSFDFWEIQFGHPAMVFLLVITFVMIMISLLIAMYIRHPKNDL